MATPIDGASTIASHLLFYLSRLAWHAAPWSLALIAIVLTQWKSVAASSATAAEPIKRGAIFAGLFVVLVVAILLPSSRFAERYAFSATYALATLGAMVAWCYWPALTRLVSSLDRIGARVSRRVVGRAHDLADRRRTVLATNRVGLRTSLVWPLVYTMSSA